MLRRVGLWSRRNKGWAAAIAVGLVALMMTAAGGVLVSKIRANAALVVAGAAREKQHEAERRVVAEHQQTQTQRREALIQQMQRVRLTYQRNGWSMDAWDLARRAAAIQPDSRIQAEAATTLAGLDARKVKSLALPGTGLAFDPSGKLLIVSGSNSIKQEQARPVHIWESATDQIGTIGIEGDGAIGFQADGAPVFLTIPKKTPSVAQLWNVNKAQVAREFTSPGKEKSSIRAYTLTPDGQYVAVSAGPVDSNGEPSGEFAIACWEASTGKELLRAKGEKTTDLSLAPDGRLLAVGHLDGVISIWSIPDKKLIASLTSSRDRITCLGFGRDPVSRGRDRSTESGWILAVGDEGGGVKIWDLRTRVPRSICHGPTGSPPVFAMAFSPDGMTLASAGRGSAQLWDIASGKFLLNIDAGNYVTALAFSPEGKKTCCWESGCVRSP